MIPISVIITAPIGIDKCLVPAGFLAEADGKDLEVIIVDGAKDFVDRSRPGLKHVSIPNAPVVVLVSEGMRHASKDWIVFFEDHGRPLPGLVAAYREAIAANPDIDLFSGAMENLTSTSPWSFASFLFNSTEFWPPAHGAPAGAIVANLAVRRSAILPSELAAVGALEMMTIPRLASAHRYRHWPKASVDHTRHLTWRQALGFQYASSVTYANVNLRLGLSRGILYRLAKDCARFPYVVLWTPWRKLSALEGTDQHHLAMIPKFILLGLAGATAIILCDLKSLGTRNT